MKTMKKPFDRYGIEDDGTIYSLIKREPFKMKTYLDKDGYVRVSIMTNDFKKKKVIVSRMVYIHYGNNDYEGLVVRHKDGNKLNNHISNLEIGTVLDNNRDKQRHGTQCRHENHGIAKLKVENVKEIRNSKEKASSLAVKFNVTKGRISQIKRGEGWAGIH